VKDGIVKVQKPKEYALKDAAAAHKDLAARKTTGSIILIP
jgi:NADPH2:quinone reductase